MPRDPLRHPRPRRLKRPLDRLLPRLRNLHAREKLQVCCYMSELVNGQPAAALIEQARRP